MGGTIIAVALVIFVIWMLGSLYWSISNRIDPTEVFDYGWKVYLLAGPMWWSVGTMFVIFKRRKPFWTPKKRR